MAKIGPPFGRVPWNKGLVIGNRCRARKLFLTQLCVQCGAEFQAYPSQRRKYCSPSCRSKYCFAPERNPKVGKKLSQEHREALSASHIGVQAKEKHPRWKGGQYATARKEDMASLPYKRWRQAVFQRDNYRCIDCGVGGYLHADHILPYATYPDLRYELSNGRTLCAPCHIKTPTFGGRTQNV